MKKFGYKLAKEVYMEYANRFNLEYCVISYDYQNYSEKLVITGSKTGVFLPDTWIYFPYRDNVKQSSPSKHAKDLHVLDREFMVPLILNMLFEIYEDLEWADRWKMAAQTMNEMKLATYHWKKDQKWTPAYLSDYLSTSISRFDEKTNRTIRRFLKEAGRLPHRSPEAVLRSMERGCARNKSNPCERKKILKLLHLYLEVEKNFSDKDLEEENPTVTAVSLGAYLTHLKVLPSGNPSFSKWTVETLATYLRGGGNSRPKFKYGKQVTYTDSKKGKVYKGINSIYHYFAKKKEPVKVEEPKIVQTEIPCKEESWDDVQRQAEKDALTRIVDRSTTMLKNELAQAKQDLASAVGQLDVQEELQGKIETHRAENALLQKKLELKDEAIASLREVNEKLIDATKKLQNPSTISVGGQKITVPRGWKKHVSGETSGMCVLKDNFDRNLVTFVTSQKEAEKILPILAIMLID